MFAYSMHCMAIPVLVGGEGDGRIDEIVQLVVVDSNGEATDVVINKNIVSIHNKDNFILKYITIYSCTNRSMYVQMAIPVHFVGGEGDGRIDEIVVQLVVVDSNGEATDVVINKNIVSIHNKDNFILKYITIYSPTEVCMFKWLYLYWLVVKVMEELTRQQYSQLQWIAMAKQLMQ